MYMMKIYIYMMKKTPAASKLKKENGQGGPRTQTAWSKKTPAESELEKKKRASRTPDINCIYNIIYRYNTI